MTQNIQPIGPSGSGNVSSNKKARLVDPKVKQQGLENDLFTLSYQHHSRDGKFSLGQCLKNVGTGIWEGIKGIGKALTTPVGFLTAAAVVGLSIAFPPVGLAIGAGFMLFGGAKIVGNTAKMIGEYSKGNYDAAESKAYGVGEGVLEVGLGYLGVRGGIKAMKAKGMNPKTYFTDGAKNMYNSGKAKLLSASDYVKGKLGYKAPQGNITSGSNLPATVNSTPTDIAVYKGGSSTGSTSTAQANPNLKALPQPKGTTTNAGSAKTSGTSTNGRVTGSTKNAKQITEGNTTTGVNNVIQQAVKDMGRIDKAKEVTFFERVGGRSVKQTVKNPYEVLGVDRSASPTQIKAAWKKLAIKFHPDKGHGVDSKYITEVNDAYTLLSNSSKRSSLDFELFKA